ncbi:glutathione S-transferase family protein [Pseudomonas sp. Marseille-P9899]|uniref:glutathione S-transferase family protein n=1 Tax=Pseudomonas sp. Marseille-P9899 TaxID=2730401 RepID=UPI00158B3973|nr:glutathione S-transferase family protein [Pseudomonas sp. Marseille-P9899]
MITLYHSKDSRSLRCLWLLQELGLPHQVEWVAFPPQLKQPEYLQINPNGTVPYLIDGENALRESAAILLYLANRYGHGNCVVPVDSPFYAAMLDWLFYGETALAGSLSAALRYAMFLPRPQRNEVVAQDYREMMVQRLDALDRALAQGPYLCGDTFTIADISVGYGLLLGELLGLAPRYPQRIADYLARLKDRPAFLKARGLAN